MKMKKMIKSFLLVCLVVITLASCSKVPAGYVGIKVHLLGGSKGVDNEVLGVGRYWIGVNEELYIFPTYQINYVYTASKDEGKERNEEFTFQTKEGMECTMDLGLAMHFENDKITKMFQVYRKGEEDILDVVVRNSIRDALNKTAGSMMIESVYGEGKGVLIANVQSAVKASLDSTGIIVDKLSLIGSVRIPKSVKDALDSKVEMTQQAQKAENGVLKAKADADIAIAKANGEAQSVIINAKAEAEANKLITQSLSDQLIRYNYAQKWDGHLPTVTGGNTPFINLNK
jgi:regulator of protease activity HflC (stomatin/prohibitin superfamily)